MKRRPPIATCFFAATLAVTNIVFAAGVVHADDCAPVVRDGWVRLPPARMPMTAGFGRLQNDCAVPVTIVAAGSPSFAAVELHETRVEDGVNRMRHVAELHVAPADAVVLRPGGLHLMLMRPHAPLEEGRKVVVELVLADGRSVQGEFEVRRPGTP